MAARRIEDLPKHVASVSAELEERGTERFCKLRFVDKDGEQAFNESGTDLIGLMDIQYHAQSGYWVVDSIDAEDGWGRFLCEIAIEWATLNGLGLIPYHHGITEDGERLWLYFYQREDISRIPLPNEIAEKLSIIDKTPLRQAYTKTMLLIEELRRTSKWQGPTNLETEQNEASQ